MTEVKQQTEVQAEPVKPKVHVAPSPHAYSSSLTTRKMMLDVLIALVPVVAISIYVFRMYAVTQLAICIASCVVAEAVFTKMRRRPLPLGDYSAVVTGAILALSLPGAAPWFIGVIGSFVAIALGKVVFGGVGANIFNPAMVGRAFVMIAFPAMLAAGVNGYIDPQATVDVITTQATPMDAFKMKGEIAPLWNLFLGNTNGSLGETSALMCLIGGLYLCIRRTASWEIPLGVILAVFVGAVIAEPDNSTTFFMLLAQGEFSSVAQHCSQNWIFVHHLLGGALLFGAFFIATDPVSSPLTPKGKFIFGAILGAMVIIFRTLSGYPEGVMFAVLLANSVVPLINRWTIPRPVGGPVPAAAKK